LRLPKLSPIEFVIVNHVSDGNFRTKYGVEAIIRFLEWVFGMWKQFVDTIEYIIEPYDELCGQVCFLNVVSILKWIRNLEHYGARNFDYINCLLKVLRKLIFFLNTKTKKKEAMLRKIKIKKY